MTHKRIISCVLAFSILFSVMPVSAIDVTDIPSVGEETLSSETDTEITAETTVPDSSEISESVTESTDSSPLPVVVSAIQLNKVSETDSSVTISWSGVYGETFSHYEVYCNGNVVQTDLTDTVCTVTGLTSGNEYGIAVYAYDVDGNVIGMSNTEYYSTNWSISGDTVLTSDKIVPNLYINSGTLNLNGHTLTVKGNVYLGATGNRAYLNINNGKLYADGNFNMCRTNGGYGEGYLTMTSPEDYICVNGNFYVYTYYNYSNLTDGTIEIKGNFTQRQYSYENNFNPGGNHRFLLSGESIQTIDFASTESRFNILEVRNYSAEGVVFSTPVTMNKYIDNGCNVTFSNGERTGWTLESDETIEGDINLSRGILDLNGHKLTITEILSIREELCLSTEASLKYREITEYRLSTGQAIQTAQVFLI